MVENGREWHEAGVDGGVDSLLRVEDVCRRKASKYEMKCIGTGSRYLSSGVVGTDSAVVAQMRWPDCKIG